MERAAVTADNSVAATGFFHTAHAADKPIAPPWHGGNQVRAQQLAQRGNVHLQVVFFNDQPKPNQLKQLRLTDKLNRTFHQYAQHIKRPGSQHHGVTVSQQLAFVGAQDKVRKSHLERHDNIE